MNTEQSKLECINCGNIIWSIYEEGKCNRCGGLMLKIETKENDTKNE